MRDRESTIQAEAEEFLQAARDLREQGLDHVYISEIGRQMARNDETFRRPYRLAAKVLGVVGIKLPEPAKDPTELYPVAARLEQDGMLASGREPAALDNSRYPRRRLYWLAEEPVLEKV